MGAGHDHGHSHGGPPPTGTAAAAYKNRLRIALGITLSVMVIEIIGGLVADSLALIADAAHMATDAVGLAMALLAIHFANRPPRGTARSGTPGPRSWRRSRTVCCSWASAAMCCTRRSSGSWSRPTPRAA